MRSADPAALGDPSIASPAVLVATRLARARELVLDGIRAHAARIRDVRLRELLLDYPLRPAKALRPALLIATVEALGGAPDAAIPTAIALELHHNAFLLHDDVEDGSALRRRLPTLHALHGPSIAINTGDAMLALALAPLLENTEVVGLGRTLQILDAFATMARVTATGQALELDWIRAGRWDLSDLDYLRMVHRKTAWYSFVTPVRAGAIIAGAPPHRVRALALAAARIGVAFQIADDLLSLEGDAAAVGKDELGDLYEGKRTLILLHALRRATPGERERALEVLAKRAPAALPAALAAFCSRHGLGLTAAAELAELVEGARGRSRADVELLLDLVRRTGAERSAREVARRIAARGRRALWRGLEGEASEAAAFLDAIGAWALSRGH